MICETCSKALRAQRATGSVIALDKLIAKRHNKAVYCDGDKVIKLFDPGYPKADVLGEAHSQSLVEATTIPVPRVLEVCLIDRQWAIVSERIEGSTLADS